MKNTFVLAPVSCLEQMSDLPLTAVLRVSPVFLLILPQRQKGIRESDMCTHGVLGKESGDFKEMLNLVSFMLFQTHLIFLVACP